MFEVVQPVQAPVRQEVVLLLYATGEPAASQSTAAVHDSVPGGEPAPEVAARTLAEESELADAAVARRQTAFPPE